MAALSNPHFDVASVDAYWMPFTANRRFKRSPLLLESANGMHYRDREGRPVLDACAGLWCVNAGHGRPEITAAVSAQLERLDYAPSFQISHSAAFQLAERLAAIAPTDGTRRLDRIFFTGSGSESVDTALKMALAYQRALGRGSRTRLIGRERGYHGVGFGGMSVGGIGPNRHQFLHLPGTDHLRHTHDPQRNGFAPGLPLHGVELADDLQRLVELHGAESIAAVIVEPVAGSTGVLPPPQGYLKRLREICDRHSILLIFDEVITGFGRLGGPFAADVFAVMPDIITTAKALTNGAIPMGAVFASREIADAVLQGPEHQIEFFHGYTYSGHPVACAAALAMLDICEAEGLFGRVGELGPTWAKAVHALSVHPLVKDIRSVGLMAGIDLAPDPEGPGIRGYRLFRECLRQGLFVRVTADTVALSPPLIISREQIDQLFAILSAALAALD